MIDFLKSLVASPVRTISALVRLPSAANNRARWMDASELRSDWDERTIQIAGRLPANASVLEFGAGNRVLEAHLPAGARYRPSDIVSRGPDTIVCDLNVELPHLTERYTDIVFSGVLEYLQDLPAVLRHLAPHTDRVIASYATTDLLKDWVTRRESGWLNHYSEAELDALFRASGYRQLSRETWQGQVICCYTTVATDDPPGVS